MGLFGLKRRNFPAGYALPQTIARFCVQSAFLSQHLTKGPAMSTPVTLAELDQRIRDTRENIRTLVEQAAALSGAADETRSTDLIAAQEAQLVHLQKEREALEKFHSRL